MLFDVDEPSLAASWVCLGRSTYLVCICQEGCSAQATYQLVIESKHTGQCQIVRLIMDDVKYDNVVACHSATFPFIFMF